MQKNINIRQRVLGAIFFVSIAIIVLPYLLSGEGVKLIKSVDIVIPEQSTPSFKVNSKQQIKDNIDKAFNKLSKNKQSPIPDNLSDKDKLKLKAWSVQLVTYSKEEHAFDFRDKLIKNSFAAYVEKFMSNKKYLYKVKVGPLPKRSEADKISKEIAVKYNLKPIVIQYP